MYPAFRTSNKDFGGVFWKLWLKKNATQFWQNANLINEVSVRIGIYVMLGILLYILLINMSDITAYL